MASQVSVLAFVMRTRSIPKNHSVFTLSAAAVYGALACYKSNEHAQYVKQKNKECQGIMFKMLDELGLEYAESNANFVYFDSGRPATEVIETLKKHHILIGMAFKQFPTWVRISLTTPEETQFIVDKFKELFG